MVEAFRDAWRDHSIGVLILTGAGDRAFSSGGDQAVRSGGGYRGGMNVEALHEIIRDIPKPVIAAVNGYAIGPALNLLRRGLHEAGDLLN